MSQENVEIVRRQFELWSEGDLDGWAQDWDPEVVVVPPEGWPEGARSEGAMRGVARPSACATPGSRRIIEIDEIRPVGTDRAVTRIRYVTLGKEGGMSFDTPMAAAIVLRDRKIIRADYFWDFAEALEAAGLSE